MPCLAQVVCRNPGEGSHCPTALSADFDARWNTNVKQSVTLWCDGERGIGLGNDRPVRKGWEKMDKAVVVGAVPAGPFDISRKILKCTGFREVLGFPTVDRAHPRFVKAAEEEQIEGANF